MANNKIDYRYLTDPRYLMAQEAYKQGIDGRPVYSGAEGLAKLAQALGGAWMAKSAQRDIEQEIKDEAAKQREQRSAAMEMYDSGKSYAPEQYGDKTIYWEDEGGKTKGLAAALGVLESDDDFAQMLMNADLQRKQAETSQQKQLEMMMLQDKLSRGRAEDLLSMRQDFEREKMAAKAGEKRPLSATEQKEFYEAEDIANAAESSLQTLQEAKALNEKGIMSGIGSGAMGIASRLPIAEQFISKEDKQKATNTTAYNNLLQNLVAESLKATFPGAVTRDERAFLENMQAISDYSQAEQKKILEQGEKILARKAEIARRKQKDITSGNIYQDNDSGINLNAMPDELDDASFYGLQ